MDCRLPLLVALGLVASAAGCRSSKCQVPCGPCLGPSVSAKPAPEAIKPAPARDAGMLPPALPAPAGGGSAKKPSAATKTAEALYFERAALAAKVDPAQRPKMLDRARMTYLEALKLDADHLPAYAGLARVYVHLDIPDRARETYEQALKRVPGDAAVWADLGMLHCRQKNWPAAIEYLKKAHELNAESRPIAQNLGFCLARAGRTEESLAVLSRVMSVAQAHYNVARMLIHLQRDQEARPYLHVALQRDPNLQGAAQLLARIEGHATPASATAAAAPQLDIIFASEEN